MPQDCLSQQKECFTYAFLHIFIKFHKHRLVKLRWCLFKPMVLSHFRCATYFKLAQMLRPGFPDLIFFHQEESHLKASIFSNFQKGSRKSHKTTYEANRCIFQSDVSVDLLHTKVSLRTSDSGTAPKKSAISSACRSPRSFCYLFCIILIAYFLDYIFSNYNLYLDWKYENEHFYQFSETTIFIKYYLILLWNILLEEDLVKQNLKITNTLCWWKCTKNLIFQLLMSSMREKILVIQSLRWFQKS